MTLSRILMVLALAVLAYLVYMTMNDSTMRRNEKDSVVTTPSDNEVSSTPLITTTTTSVDGTITTTTFSPLITSAPVQTTGVTPAQTTGVTPAQTTGVTPAQTTGVTPAQTTGVTPEQTTTAFVPPQTTTAFVPPQTTTAFVPPQTTTAFVPPQTTTQQAQTTSAGAGVEQFFNKIKKMNREGFQNEAPAPSPAINYNKMDKIAGISDSVHGAAPFGSNQPVEEGDMATVKYTGMVDGTAGDVIQIEGTDLLTAPLVDNMLYTNSIANTNRNASNDLRGDIPLQFNDTYTPFYSSVIYGAPLSQKQMTIGAL